MRKPYKYHFSLFSSHNLVAFLHFLVLNVGRRRTGRYEMAPAIIWRGFSQRLYGGAAPDIRSLAFLTLNEVHLLLTAAGERNLQIGAHVQKLALGGCED